MRIQQIPFKGTAMTHNLFRKTFVALCLLCFLTFTAQATDDFNPLSPPDGIWDSAGVATFDYVDDNGYAHTTDIKVVLVDANYLDHCRTISNNYIPHYHFQYEWGYIEANCGGTIVPSAYSVNEYWDAFFGPGLYYTHVSGGGAASNQSNCHAYAFKTLGPARATFGWWHFRLLV